MWGASTNPSSFLLRCGSFYLLLFFSLSYFFERYLFLEKSCIFLNISLALFVGSLTTIQKGIILTSKILISEQLEPKADRAHEAFKWGSFTYFFWLTIFSGFWLHNLKHFSCLDRNLKPTTITQTLCCALVESQLINLILKLREEFYFLHR